MAHSSTLTGGVSESIAQAMFLRHGFSVYNTVVPEPYDLVVGGKDADGNNEMFTVQIKTLKIRHDREGQLVVKGAGGDRKPYSKADVDYLFGIHIPSQTGFLIPNTEQVEYWAKDFDTARKKWTEFNLN